MTVKKIPEHQKAAVASLYESKKHTLQEIATMFGASSRTIARVLEEKGLLLPRLSRLTPEAMKIMQLLYTRKIGADVLEQILDTPALIPGNVALFLKDCTKEQLYVILSGAGLITNADETIRKLAGLAVLNAPEGKPIPKSAQMSLELPLTRCAASRDGECTHKQCPQLRDNEPHKSGRHCPLYKSAEEEQQ